jgi:Carbohydrate-selective porin, OprB family/S-layer homology domain
MLKNLSKVSAIALAIANVQTAQADPNALIANPISQGVSSVSQLSDVQPTDWAFTATQSLVERYGCIIGYPDKTFRGQRAITRYEFAAGLNACADKINELISSGLSDKVGKEDLATLQKLQEEFSAELATIKGRMTAVESKAATLEAQQFSTTTKLSGEVIFAVTGSGNGNNPVYGADTNAFGLVTPVRNPALTEAGVAVPTGVVRPITGRVTQPSGNANTTFNARVRLDFQSSFTGSDLLLTRLEAGNGGSFFNNSPRDYRSSILLTSNFGNAGAGSFGNNYSGVDPTFRLAKLRYDFNLGRDLRVSIGPVIHTYDHIDKNSYANNEASDFSSNFFTNNPLILLLNNRSGGAGGALDWNPGQGDFSFRAVYIAPNGSEPAGGPTNPNANLPGQQPTPPGPPLPASRGLFGNPNENVFEFEYAPKLNGKKGNFAIRLQYTRGDYGNRYGNTGGANVEWTFAKNMAIFGRYGFGTVTLFNGLNSFNTFTNVQTTINSDDISYNIQTFQVGLAFPDLFQEGALGAIAIGQPFIEGKTGNATQTNLEAFFRFPISKNISITPDVQFIFNPNNNSFNSTIIVGTLRTVFRF